MENYQVQQEVLLFTGTSFSVSRLLNREDRDNVDPLYEVEQLLEACWNGALYDMLPEVKEQSGQGVSLYLWQIREAIFFLGLEFGEFQAGIDREYSVNPYSFLPMLNLN